VLPQKRPRAQEGEEQPRWPLAPVAVALRTFDHNCCDTILRLRCGREYTKLGKSIDFWIGRPEKLAESSNFALDTVACVTVCAVWFAKTHAGDTVLFVF
jgi:hypothetical protein